MNADEEPASPGPGAGVEPLSDEQVDVTMDAAQRNAYIKWLTLFVAVGSIALIAVLRFGVLPITREVVGQTTDFNFSVSVGINIALAIPAIGGPIAALQLNKQRRYHKRRARRLERQVKELKKGSK